MDVSTRKRLIPYRRGSVVTQLIKTSTGDIISSNESWLYLNGSQETTSEGHPWRGTRASTRQRDIGGEFTTTKTEFEHLDGPEVIAASYPTLNNTTRKLAPVFTRDVAKPTDIKGNFPVGQLLSKADVLALGATAIAKTIPTAPEASLSVALGETIKDGLPSKIGAQLRNQGGLGHKASGEFLNYNFGVVPLLNDVKQVISAVSRSSEIIDQLKRDSGRQVRRRMSFPSYSETTTEVNEGFTIPSFPSPFLKGGRRRTEIRKRRFVWFSGAYVYHWPVDDSSSSRFKEYRSLGDSILGLNLNAETIWNILPWSWLIDWQTNVGDVLKNISYIGRDGLVLKYGYIMVTEVTEWTDTLEGYTFNNGYPLPRISQRYTHVSKRRYKATPYGFGLNPSSFSAKQWAILAALGISRGPNQL